MLRRALLLASALSLALTGLAGARTHATARKAAVAPAATFFISGRGWGHGVGMSQWGAYGYAQRGMAYDKILAHYYSGTTLGKAPVARIRVLLGEGKKALAVSSDSPFSVKDGSGAVSQLEPGAYQLGPALKLKVDPTQPAKALPGPLVFQPGGTPLKYAGKEYRGQLQINQSKTALQIVNNVGLEPYLYGVVPREVPFAWPPEALKAQAVVARSYALAVRKTGNYDVFADTRSQVYGGVAAEKPSTSAAVDATAGQVVLYEGKVATTFFFSTSGGRTASVQDAWARGEPTPYLVSVPDPYETASPHHVWGPFEFTGAKLRSTFKVPGQLVDVKLSVNASQRVDEMTLVGTKGEVVVPGEVVRTKLGLRSTWFRVGVLGIEPSTAPVEYGGTTKLTGLARGGSKVTLEQRVSGKLWEPAARLKTKADGTFAINVKPLVSTDYRISVSATLAGRPVHVSVAPRVRLQPATVATALRGLVRPIVPGTRVDVQRLVGSSWRPAATATLADNGSFEAALDLTPGTYRARVAPGRGLVPGTSPVLRVVTG